MACARRLHLRVDQDHSMNAFFSFAECSNARMLEHGMKAFSSTARNYFKFDVCNRQTVVRLWRAIAEGCRFLVSSHYISFWWNTCVIHERLRLIAWKIRSICTIIYWFFIPAIIKWTMRAHWPSTSTDTWLSYCLILVYVLIKKKWNFKVISALTLTLKLEIY